MPKGRSRQALVRSGYTGEEPDAARSGIAHDGQPGLDECTEEQQHLRALLALAILNTGVGQAPAGRWGLHYLTAYNTVFSPRWNRFVLITQEPDKMAGYLVPGYNGIIGIPGMRVLARSRNGRTIVCNHLPNGAQLEITSLAVPRCLDPGAALPRNAPTPLTSKEHDELSVILPMTPDARLLLAALAVRLRTGDPLNRWLVGDRRYKPGEGFDFSELDKPPTGWGPERTLWGAGDAWELRWDTRLSRPAVADIVAALTDKVIGVHGAVASVERDGAQIRLGAARLQLRSWQS